MNLSIIVASHGDERWQRLAETRAVPSAHKVVGALEVLYHHSRYNTRAEVRNQLAKEASGDWLCFLDADDELHHGYFRHMQRAEEPGCLLTPAVQYVSAGKPQRARFWPETDLKHGNWMVVGTLIEATLFHSLGGWKTYMATGVLNEYDDWAMWIRAVRAGARPVKVPRAVYIAHMERTSGHRKAAHNQRLAWVKEIQEAEWA